MAEFLRTNGISSCIEDIITKAEKELTLISPYLDTSKNLQERLSEASENVSIKIIYGKKKKLKPEQINFLKELKNLKLFYCNNLHAKCYFNEKEMVITSMNLYEFSEKTNREMGVFVKQDNDKTLFDEAVKEAHSIEKISISKEAHSIEEDSTRESSSIKKASSIRKAFSINPKFNPPLLLNPFSVKSSKVSGYCIRCKEPVRYNTKEPYCPKHLKSWEKWRNVTYEEEHCHSCGKSEPTSMKIPECRECYNKNKPNSNSKSEKPTSGKRWRKWY